MALIGISVGETFEYVLDRDPCKKRVELEVPRVEDAAPDHAAADHRDSSMRFHPRALPYVQAAALIACARRTDSLVSDPVVLLFTAGSASRGDRMRGAAIGRNRPTVALAATGRRSGPSGGAFGR